MSFKILTPSQEMEMMIHDNLGNTLLEGLDTWEPEYEDVGRGGHYLDRENRRLASGMRRPKKQRKYGKSAFEIQCDAACKEASETLARIRSIGDKLDSVYHKPEPVDLNLGKPPYDSGINSCLTPDPLRVTTPSIDDVVPIFDDDLQKKLPSCKEIEKRMLTYNKT
jgi:hypothetical protein